MTAATTVQARLLANLPAKEVRVFISGSQLRCANETTTWCGFAYGWVEATYVSPDKFLSGRWTEIGPAVWAPSDAEQRLTAVLDQINRERAFAAGLLAAAEKDLVEFELAQDTSGRIVRAATRARHDAATSRINMLNNLLALAVGA